MQGLFLQPELMWSDICSPFEEFTEEAWIWKVKLLGNLCNWHISVSKHNLCISCNSSVNPLFGRYSACFFYHYAKISWCNAHFVGIE